ncbi:MAG: hypothetical protein IKK38_06440 [Spirochaetaceae bacterium]|nr:hypothetical protein [Spirochaetaceae bacterium]
MPELSTIIPVIATLTGSLFTLLINCIYNERREKRAAAQNLLYHLLPERQQFIKKVIAVSSQSHISDICNNPASFLTATGEFFKFNDEITSLVQDSIFWGSKDVVSELVNLSKFLIAFQQSEEVINDTPENQVSLFSASIKPFTDSLYNHIRKENYTDVIDALTKEILDDNKKRIKKLWKPSRKVVNKTRKRVE